MSMNVFRIRLLIGILPGIGGIIFMHQLNAESPTNSRSRSHTETNREIARRAALARGERGPAITATDLEARERFLEVERFARLPGDRQERELRGFYRKWAPFYMNSMYEGILSSCPGDILNRSTSGFIGGDVKAVWARQLADAANTLTAEEVADILENRLWLDVAGRARTVQLLKQCPEALAALIAEDLASNDLLAVKRACAVIGDFRLRQFTDKVLALYLADTPLSQPARTALVWLGDPATVRPLIQQIDKDPKSIARHAGLFQGPLAGCAAEPTLVNLLDSPDADLRYHAAYALYECRDAALAKPIAKLAKETEPRLQIAALKLAMRLPDDAFATIRSDLVPLISSKDDGVRLEAITCFAKRKDRKH